MWVTIICVALLLAIAYEIGLKCRLHLRRFYYKNSLDINDSSSDIVVSKMPRTKHSKFVPRDKKKDAVKKTVPAKSKNMNDHRRKPEFIVRHDSVCVNFSKPSTTSYNVSSATVFTDHNHKSLYQTLERYARGKILLICVPWLTSDVIIGWLSRFAKAVHVIVNREDYSKWGNGCVTREKYSPLKGLDVPFSHIWGNRIETPLNQLREVYRDSVRCYGDPSEGNPDAGGKKKQSFISSIMHSKYIVICDESDMPRYLWGGSMNMTANSDNNQEFNFFLDDPALAMHMFHDFASTFLESETLKF